jgi:outer membrane biosynthesis protein TonB
MYRLVSATVATPCMGFLFAGTPSANLNPYPHFEPIAVLSAEDIKYPPPSVAVGTVVLELTVDEKGLLQDVQAVRQIQTLTEAAANAVEGWQFKPALLDRNPIRSRTTVAVLFNSVATYPYETALGAGADTETRSDSSVEPEPIKVTEAAFVRYPVNSQTTGTVILKATIDTDGAVEKVVAVRDVPALTEACVEGLKRWKFQAAEFHGSPISSTIYIAFVLRPPNGS